MSEGKSDRVMTSAIDGLSVAQVRRGLGEMRSKYEAHSLGQPLCLTEPLYCGKTIQHFAHQYCLGHHEKRHNKSKSHGQRKGREAKNTREPEDYPLPLEHPVESPLTNHTSLEGRPQPTLTQLLRRHCDPESRK